MKNFFFVFCLSFFILGCTKRDDPTFNNTFTKVTGYPSSSSSFMTILRDTVIIASNNYSMNNSGKIYTSSNGEKWNTMKVVGDVQYISLISYKDELYISTTDKIYCSNTMSNTWTEKSNGLSGNIYISSLVGTDAGLFTCGTSLFRSIDNGNNWTEITIPGLLEASSIVSINNTLIACITKSSEVGLYRSDDDGATWTYINSPLTNHFKWKLFILNNVVHAMSSMNSVILSSYDSGKTWSRESPNGLTVKGPNIIQSIELNTGIMYAATKNGVFKSNDNGRNWIYMGCWDVQSLCIKDNIIYAGTAEQGLWFSPTK